MRDISFSLHILFSLQLIPCLNVCQTQSPHDVKPVTRGLFDITEIVKFDPKYKYL